MPDPFDRSRMVAPRVGAQLNPADILAAFQNMQANGGGDFRPDLSQLNDGARAGIGRIGAMAGDYGLSPKMQRKMAISASLEQRVRTLEKLVLGGYARDSVFSDRQTWTTGTTATFSFNCRFTRGCIPLLSNVELQSGAGVEAITSFNTGNETLSLADGVGENRFNPVTLNWVPWIIRREMLNPSVGLLVVGSASGTNSAILELLPLDGIIGDLADDIDRLGKMLQSDDE